MKKHVKIYLAGSMFCEGDRMYNAYLAKKIRENFTEDQVDLYVPQENLSINDKTKCADSRAIFFGDYERLQKTDVLIARIDGDLPPSGTSAEIGMMAQRSQQWKKDFHDFIKNKDLTKLEITDFLDKFGEQPYIVGLCTDSRNPKRTYLEAKNELMKNSDIESQYCYYNLFTVGCIKENGTLTTDVDTMLAALKKYINE